MKGALGALRSPCLSQTSEISPFGQRETLSRSHPPWGAGLRWQKAAVPPPPPLSAARPNSSVPPRRVAESGREAPGRGGSLRPRGMEPEEKGARAMSSQACTGEWPGRTGPGRQKMRGTRPRRGLRGQAGGGRPPRVRGSARPSAARLPQPRGAGEPQAGVGWRLERRRSRNLTPPRQSSPSPPLLKLLPAPRAASPAPIPRAGITGGQRAGEQVGVGERSRGPASRGVGSGGSGENDYKGAQKNFGG